MSAVFPGHERARHMGELRRGDVRWDVFLECEPDATAGTVRGRLHFVSDDVHHETGWVFLEWNEKDIRDRFGEFSAIELWRFLESLAAGPSA